jgi:GNAT superfamily N-acetyltransferase
MLQIVDCPGYRWSQSCLKQNNYDHYHTLAERAVQTMPNRWHLLLIAVDAIHQRQGVATVLMEWGFATAAREGVPIALESTEKGKRLYEKHGFVTKEFLELCPGLKVPSMFWEPKRTW